MDNSTVRSLKKFLLNFYGTKHLTDAKNLKCLGITPIKLANTCDILKSRQITGFHNAIE